MTILVFNNGSTSLRFSVLDTKKNIVLANGGAENIGTISSYYKYENNRGYTQKKIIEINNSDDALKLIIESIFDVNIGVLNSVNDVDVIGHRVVHGGEKYFEPVIVDDDVLNDIERLSNFAPLHNKKIAENIRNCQIQFYGKENIAVFDTSFHLTIPKENYLYAIPYELYEKYKIRKYGFHGISYNYVLNRYVDITNSKKDNSNVVICHLGGGSSICTIKNGKSFDTTMGFSPLSGLIMASRAGSVDPAMIPYIMKIYNMSADEVVNMLNINCGYFAMCNSKDTRVIVDRSLNGDSQSILLRNMINNDFKKYLLSMMANIENVDAIIMTGGIGEKNIEQREMLLSGLTQFGILLDNDKNRSAFGIEAIISDKKSKIPVYVIPTDEEREIATQCKSLMLKRR